MPAEPSPSKQSRTHQSAVSLPPCRELIEQVDAHMLKQYAFAQRAHRNVKTTGPPPLIQRAPGQAPYTRSHPRSLPPLLPSNVMLPQPSHVHLSRTVYGPYSACRPVATSSRPATHQFREVTPLPPTVVNPHPDLRMFVVSPENYYAVMQSSSSVMTNAPTPGQAPVSHSKRTNNNAEGIDRKTTANGKAAVKTRRDVRRSEGAE